MEDPLAQPDVPARWLAADPADPADPAGAPASGDVFATPPMFWRPAGLVAAVTPATAADLERLAHLPFAFWLIDAWRPARLALLGDADDPFHAGLREALARLRVGAAVTPAAAFDDPAAAGGDIALLSVARPMPQGIPQAWLDRLARPAVVVIAGGPPPPPGLPRFSFTHGGGLHVLVAGGDPGGPLAALLALAETAQAAPIRDRFAALGAGLAAERRAGALDGERARTVRRAELAATEAASVRRLLTDAHAQAIANDLARRKVKRLNKMITRSWSWSLVRPLWLLESGLRRLGSGGDAPRYGIGDRDYRRWIARHDRLGGDDRRLIAADIARLAALPGGRPRIALVMAVAAAADPGRLTAAIASVRAQLYPDWELCIATDGAGDAGIRPLVDAAAAADPRIRVHHRPTAGGPAAAGNSALELVTGAFVGFLGEADALAPHALYLVARTIAGDPAAELIYSDEDHLDAAGRRHTPHFKPRWNPDLLLSTNYVCHLAVFRSERLRALGGLRAACAGSADWDLVLRVAAAVAAERIHHIPHILYHWRNQPDQGRPPAADLATAAAGGRLAVADHLAGRGIEAEVSIGIDGRNRVLRALPPAPPPVTVIVPTRDRLDLLRVCLDGVLERTRYPGDIEVIVVDNGSVEAATLAYLQAIAADARVRVLRQPGAFNYAALNNAAAAVARGTVLCLLNNDVEVIGSDWLAVMVAHALRPEVGAVGARLLYGNARVQHGGCILGIHGSVGHAHVLLERGDPGYFGRARVTQNLSAVTGACLVTRSDCFRRVGGLDAVNLAVAYNDIDYCLKLRAGGQLIVYAAEAELLHHESMSRGHDHISDDKRQRQAREAEWMRRTWGERLADDPCYNPNLSLDEPFTVADPPRAVKPWRRGRAD